MAMASALVLLTRVSTIYTQLSVDALVQTAKFVMATILLGMIIPETLQLSSPMMTLWIIVARALVWCSSVLIVTWSNVTFLDAIVHLIEGTGHGTHVSGIIAADDEQLVSRAFPLFSISVVILSSNTF